MGAKRRREFRRPIGRRRYKTLFILATEGFKTESQYFKMLNSDSAVIRIKCLSKKARSAPEQVLKQIRTYIKDEGLRKDDEAWIVIDKDTWTDDQLSILYDWSNEKANHGFALSNPKFDYWLLLHFEEGAGVNTSRQCSDRLKRYLPDYDKDIGRSRKILEGIPSAIKRAKAKDTPPCEKWPTTTGTTVYRLIEMICNEPA